MNKHFRTLISITEVALDSNQINSHQHILNSEDEAILYLIDLITEDYGIPKPKNNSVDFITSQEESQTQSLYYILEEMIDQALVQTDYLIKVKINKLHDNYKISDFYTYGTE